MHGSVNVTASIQSREFMRVTSVLSAVVNNRGHSVDSGSGRDQRRPADFVLLLFFPVFCCCLTFVDVVVGFHESYDDDCHYHDVAVHDDDYEADV